MTTFSKLKTILAGALLASTLSLAAAPPAHKTENLFLITVDGFRWQEVFTGAEELLMNRENGGVHDSDTNLLKTTFLRETPEARREALLPFFWSTIAKRGQIYGNVKKGSEDTVTNGKKFTYPGFNEMLTGSADPRIDKNEKRNNPNVTVLEWLNQKPAFDHRIIGFANWEVHPYILNSERSGIPVWTGFETNLPATPGSPLELVLQLQRDITPMWHDMSFDVFFMHAALQYMKEKKPRVVWIALGETDEWAHDGRYDCYLFAARKMDDYVRTLWNAAQSMPEYHDKTTFLITCDHGRGSGPHEWRNHGANVEGAENIWLAALGPDTPALGERSNTPAIHQNQLAATLAALLGENYHAAVPKSAPPIKDLLPK